MTDNIFHEKVERDVKVRIYPVDSSTPSIISNSEVGEIGLKPLNSTFGLLFNLKESGMIDHSLFSIYISRIEPTT